MMRLWTSSAAAAVAVVMSLPTGRIEVVTSGHDIQSLHPETVVAALRSVLAEEPASS